MDNKLYIEKKYSFNEIAHDIRNMRVLDLEQMNKIYFMKREELIEIIQIYDSVIVYVNNILDSEHK